MDGRDFRRYAAIEALKLEHGGISYMSKQNKACVNIDLSLDTADFFMTAWFCGGRHTERSNTLMLQNY
jgi:hypothetical protein